MELKDLYKRVAGWIARDPVFVAVPDSAAAALARLTGWAPGAPITHDQWLMLRTDNVVGTETDGLAALGVTPTPLAAVAPDWLVQYRRRGRFSLTSTPA